MVGDQARRRDRRVGGPRAHLGGRVAERSFGAAHRRRREGKAGWQTHLRLTFHDGATLAVGIHAILWCLLLQVGAAIPRPQSRQRQLPRIMEYSPRDLRGLTHQAATVGPVVARPSALVTRPSGKGASGHRQTVGDALDALGQGVEGGGRPFLRLKRQIIIARRIVDDRLIAAVAQVDELIGDQ